jgi:NADH-quinone oxidoreductase E subunit
MTTDTKSHKFSEKSEKRLAEMIEKYPSKRSAIMAALYIAQDEIGWINQTAISWVAERIEVAPVQVMEVATFYTMYYKKPVGKYHVQICRTLSCALCGSKKLSEHFNKRFGLKPGEVSADGKWSFEEVECLGSCGTAPMCEINDTYFENLDIDKFEQILQRIEKETPDLRFSTIEDKLGNGLSGYPKSEV